MNVDFSKLGTWESDKALFLVNTAKKLGMDISGYGELAVNPNSGYTYIWLEDYPFTLYMPISCELTEEDVWVLWTSSEDGEETEDTLDTFMKADNPLKSIYEWVKVCEMTEEED